MADIEAYMGERLICVWNDEQTAELIRIWGNESVQAMLNTTRRNSVVYKMISDGLRERGIDRTAEQCRSKIKNLKKEYNNDRKNGTSTCRFFEQLYEILGGQQTSTVVLELDANNILTSVPSDLTQEPSVIHVVPVSEDHMYTNSDSVVTPVLATSEANIIFQPQEIKETTKEVKKRKRSPERRIGDILKEVTDKLVEFEKERDERMMNFIREEREHSEKARQEDSEREERLINYMLTYCNKTSA